jgi:hypothetical protein
MEAWRTADTPELQRVWRATPEARISVFGFDGAGRAALVHSIAADDSLLSVLKHPNMMAVE